MPETAGEVQHGYEETCILSQKNQSKSPTTILTLEPETNSD
jgi:hypothetical protein